jgi:hypothetical protein
MRTFWIHSGLSLLDVDEAGGLRVTDDFLRAYLSRASLHRSRSRALENWRCTVLCWPIQAWR